METTVARIELVPNAAHGRRRTHNAVVAAVSGHANRAFVVRFVGLQLVAPEM
jgi:hypothetical protein